MEMGGARRRSGRGIIIRGIVWYAAERQTRIQADMRSTDLVGKSDRQVASRWIVPVPAAVVAVVVVVIYRNPGRKHSWDFSCLRKPKVAERRF